jgi:nickel transport protein
VFDCFFSKTSKVNGGLVSVLDAASGEVLASGTTDEAGALFLPVPQKAIASGHDLKILLKAGEGHQGDTLVRASEFAGLKAAQALKPAARPETKPEAKSDAKAGGKAEAKQDAKPAAASPLPPQMDEAALTRIVEQAVGQAVDSRLAPVKRLLAESAAPKGPGMVEILGGIGYIFGLFGIVALVASRRKDRAGK